MKSQIPPTKAPSQPCRKIFSRERYNGDNDAKLNAHEENINPTIEQEMIAKAKLLGLIIVLLLVVTAFFVQKHFL